MITSELTSSSTLPLTLGKKAKNPCTKVESELARETSWPVGMRSWLEKSSSMRRSYMALRRSYCTSSATRPPW